MEQEVTPRTLSNPFYKLCGSSGQRLFARSIYEHDALGTKSSFDRSQGRRRSKFYDTWYAPNNAILVVVGDVDPAGDPRADKSPIRKNTGETLHA